MLGVFTDGYLPIKRPENGSVKDLVKFFIDVKRVA
jgi:hypothetical protein